MKVAGQHTFAVSQEAVWKALLDPEVLGKVVPGFERLEEKAPGQYEGALTIQVGPVKGKFEGALAISEMDPPRSYKMTLSGKGAPGFVSGRGEIRLSPADAGTELAYDFDLQIGGRIAGLGQRLLDTTSRAITKQALENLGRQLAATAQAALEGAPAPAAEAPSQTAFAAGVAREVMKELLPPWARAGLALIGLALVAVVGWWIFRKIAG